MITWLHWISIVLSVLAFALSVWAVRRTRALLPRKLMAQIDKDIEAQEEQFQLRIVSDSQLEEIRRCGEYSDFRAKERS